MRRWSAVIGGSFVLSLVLAMSQPVGATPVSDSPALGPGYELQVSNAVYGFNAPAVNSLPDNPTGGMQKCFTPTWGTCTSIGIASTGDYVSPGYWVGSTTQRHRRQRPDRLRGGGHRVRQHRNLQSGVDRHLERSRGGRRVRTVRRPADRR